MPRAELRWCALALALSVLAAVEAPTLAQEGGASGSLNPHLDTSVLPDGCVSCHQGHGVSGSPMLAEPQAALCLECHGSRGAAVSGQSASNQPASGARAAFGRSLLSSLGGRSIDEAFAEDFAHPLDRSGFVAGDSMVVCSSCHSPHRRDSARVADGGIDGMSERCLACHSGATLGATGADRVLPGVRRKTDPANRSYHPIEAPALDASPSLRPEWRGRQIGCSDCHGNADPSGARGPHGSPIPSILKLPYSSRDGDGSSPRAGLCESCHDRERLYRFARFPDHALHVEEAGISCSSCHDPHGSPTQRALIRLGDDDSIGLGPSGTSGRLVFESFAPGSGTCSMTCHGVDHAAVSYGPGGDVRPLESVVLPGSRLRPSTFSDERGDAFVLPPFDRHRPRSRDSDELDQR